MLGRTGCDRPVFAATMHEGRGSGRGSLGHGQTEQRKAAADLLAAFANKSTGRNNDG